MTQMIHTWQGRRHKWNGKEILMLSKSQFFKMVTWETSVKVRLQHLWCKKHHGSRCYEGWWWYKAARWDVCIDDKKEVHGKQNIDAHFRSIDIRGGRLENFSENTPSTHTCVFWQNVDPRIGSIYIQGGHLANATLNKYLAWKNHCPLFWSIKIWWWSGLSTPPFNVTRANCYRKVREQVLILIQ